MTFLLCKMASLQIPLLPTSLFLTVQPLLKGTTRARLLKEKRLFEEDIHLKDLDRFSGFALMNAMIDFDVVKNGIISPIKGVDNAV